MINILIPMAGRGSRFSERGYDLPKPWIDVVGKPLAQVAIETLGIKGRFIYVVQKSHGLLELLMNTTPGCIVVEIDEMTNGASSSALMAKGLINTDEPLIITNCDQAMNWSSADFEEFISTTKSDGVLVTYRSKDLKNSFAEIQNGVVTKVVEKQPLGDIALTGLHYWSKGSLFVETAEWLEENFKSEGYKETYVSATYQRLIDQGYTISQYMLEDGGYIPLGTPEDLNNYLGKYR
jgi:dTDP-glucose pyrophosphorylase